MNEKPILFNAEMVNAILSGRKTQTRRIMKSDYMEIAENDDGLLWPWREDCERGGDIWYPCPLGKPGDQLWVREAFATGLCTESTLAYRATHKTEDLEEGWGETIKWTPSIHMPRWASRINLLITGVRVERLNDISDADASAEGCKISSMQSGECLSDMFARLWKSIYGDESWQANPWVWVINFERMEAK
ncbi:phage-like protein [Yersinia mollaretii]|uniref:hypothetical protein n=1 Tax=Yersinia mollaretii TaxID=33060 RepID=UPI0005DF2A64|nr:hypothetical protein [Yersinia mollaretii]CNK69061.1 phage-like protein [Yersinia mollaretii]